MDFYFLITRSLIAVGLFLLGKIIHFFLNRGIEHVDYYAEKNGFTSLDMSKSTKTVINQVSKYIIYSIVFLLVLYVFNLNDLLMGFATAAGVSGIAIGFAAKDVLSNALSGLILAFDKPFKIGDQVQIGRASLKTEKGTVESISIRSTVIKLRDGTLITVPNSTIISEIVTNYSRNPLHLIELIIEIDIDSDVKKALKLIDAVLDKITWKDKNLGKEVYVNDVNRDNVILKVKVWHSCVDVGIKKTELFYQIRDLLKKNNIKSSVVRN